MDIVDAQVHANQLAPNWGRVDLDVTIEAAVAAMNAVGVAGVLIDEYWGFDSKTRIMPGTEGPGGVWRRQYPFAEAAVARYPHRFAYVCRIDPLDPELPGLIRERRSKPGCRALRVSKGPDGNLWRDELFLHGGYDRLFDEAQRNELPVFLKLSGRMELLVPIAERFPKTRFIVDHSGVEFPDPNTMTDRHFGQLDAVIDLARHENVSIKWSHVERLSAHGYPFEDVQPHLRRVVDAFGPQRILWASDCTEARNRSVRPASWAETAFYLRDSPLFTLEERAWMLGRAARETLSWPASS